VGYFFANEIFTNLQLFGAILIIMGMFTAEVGEYIIKKLMNV
jgi:drug/metabolite transporter (DMT)-like permease